MISVAPFGQLSDGTAVERITLQNAQGMQVSVLTLGAILQRWTLGDAQDTDIVLGFDDVDGYLQDSAYIGAVAARYANRIAKSRLSLEGQLYELSANLQGNCLHGGEDGFHRRVWQCVSQTDGPSPSVTLSLTSPDGDQGFPGTLNARVTYELSDASVLRITYEAQCDQTTVFNPTQHSYFNLAGHHSGPVGKHLVQVFAHHYTPASDDGIPSGELATVADSVFDLRQPSELGRYPAHPALAATAGLDHNWCLDDYQHPLSNLREVAIYRDPHSNRSLSVRTDMPGMQVYNGNFLPANLKGKAGATYGPYHGLCLETQFYPDSPNQPGFPSATLGAGDTFRSVTEFALALP